MIILQVCLHFFQFLHKNTSHISVGHYYYFFSLTCSPQSHIVCPGVFLQLSVYDHRIIRAMSVGEFFLIFPLRFHFIRNPSWVICVQWAIFSSRSCFMLLRKALDDIYSYLKSFDLYLHLYIIFFLCNLLPFLVFWQEILFLQIFRSVKRLFQVHSITLIICDHKSCPSMCLLLSSLFCFVINFQLLY